jgi:polyphosphate kinase
MKIPVGLKQWVPLTMGVEQGHRLLIPLHEVIRGNIGKLYSGMTTSGMTLVRITRDAQVDMEEGSPSDHRALVREQIRQRRYEPVVRLEFGRGADAGTVLRWIPSIGEISTSSTEYSTGGNSPATLASLRTTVLCLFLNLCRLALGAP